MIKGVLIGAIVLFMFGCGAKYSALAVPNNGNRQIFKDGHNILIAPRPVISVGTASGVHMSSDRPKFILMIQNNGKRSINFNTLSIKASVNYLPVSVMCYDELMAEAEANRRFQAGMAVLYGATQMMAAQQNAYSYSGGNFQGNYAGNQYSGTYSGYTYNPLAAQQTQMMAMQMTMNNIAMINTFSSQRIQDIQNIALKSHTVLPGETHGGYFYLKGLDYEKQNDVKITVSIGWEEYDFYFAFDKEGSERDFRVVEDYDKAEELFRKASVLWDSDEAKYRNPIKAIEYLTESLKYGEDPATYSNRSRAYEAIDEMDYAISDMNTAILIEPEKSSRHYMRGFLYFNIAQYNLALADFTKYSAANPHDKFGYFMKARTYILLGELNKGCVDAVKACDLGICSVLEILQDEGFCK